MSRMGSGSQEGFSMMHTEEAEVYNQVALGPNAPVYAYYAERILETTGISKGVCLDVGCGGGYLGWALSAISSLEFIFLDASPIMLRHAEQNIVAQGISHRASTLWGRVQEIPLPEHSANLVISRGSVPFWEDLPKAFKEIYRVLRPGGQAYIGGGLGPPEIRERVEKATRAMRVDWRQATHPPHRRNHEEYQDALVLADIPHGVVERSDVGTWIRFTRE